MLQTFLIQQVNGVNLERAPHDHAVDVIKNASNPVEFVVQSLVEDSLDHSNSGSVKVYYDFCHTSPLHIAVVDPCCIPLIS